SIGELDYVDEQSSDTLAICNQGVADFRATFTKHAHYNHAKHTLIVSKDVAHALELKQGDAARFFRL
ncbi:arginine N-succinyltransferase, partial [Pseudoalteromonas sp.]|nr:arginine N-succinyltransferase [Pseudoalteromonas sp.]